MSANNSASEVLAKPAEVLRRARDIASRIHVNGHTLVLEFQSDRGTLYGVMPPFSWLGWLGWWWEWKVVSRVPRRIRAVLRGRRDGWLREGEIHWVHDSDALNAARRRAAAFGGIQSILLRLLPVWRERKEENDRMATAWAEFIVAHSLGWEDMVTNGFPLREAVKQLEKLTGCKVGCCGHLPVPPERQEALWRLGGPPWVSGRMPHALNTEEGAKRGLSASAHDCQRKERATDTSDRQEASDGQ